MKKNVRVTIIGLAIGSTMLAILNANSTAGLIFIGAYAGFGAFASAFVIDEIMQTRKKGGD
jgi:hypothetical protein